ncbi:MAG: hypothetical protein IT473_02670, partial [Lysobacter sp.]|nr:hypothetical protein [Lysobacter sp.]
NYPEWLVITTFLTAQTFVIMAFALPFEHWFPHARGVAVVLSTVYGVFTLMQFFKGYARWKALLRGLFAYGFFMLVSAAFGFVFAVVLLALSGRH